MQENCSQSYQSPGPHSMPADLFDAQRRAWIAAHAGVFMFQKRRAELLAKAIRARTRAQVGARPDPHDDQVTPRFVFRSPSTSTGSFESALVTVCAVVGPLGWLLGKAAYHVLASWIPERLRAYPIPALLWASAACGLPLALFYRPSPELTNTLLLPWLLAQLPATFLAAGIYGILEGWLAVDGSSDWWPLTPEAADVDDDLILDPDILIMPTVLDPLPQPNPRRRVPSWVTTRRHTPPTIRWLPILSGATLAAIVAAWYLCAVLTATISGPNHPPGAM